MGKCLEEFFVDRIDCLSPRPTRLGLFDKAATLFDRIGQLAEGVRQLDAASVQLEAFDGKGIAGLRASQRSKRLRPINHEGRPRRSQVRLDAIEKDLVENIIPGRVR